MVNNMVSAIIITHNRKDLVQKAISSVLKQTYSNIELIVVDDSSSDGSKELLSVLSRQKGFQYVYIPNEESKGGNHARNTGMLASRGEYIAFLDDDDEWMPDKTEKQVRYLENHPICGVVTCSRIIEYDNRKQVRQKLNDRLEGDLKEKIWTKTAFNTSEMMIRRCIVEQVGLFDEELRYWQEYEYSIRLCQITEVGLIKEHLILYRVIRNDRARLTNNLAGWTEAVKYVDNKHGELFLALPDGVRRKHEAMIARDGALRAYNMGNSKMLKQYSKEVIKLEPTIKNRIKYLIYEIITVFRR